MKDQPMKIEVGKTYRTRDGYKARVICTDRRHDVCPVVAMIGFSEEFERMETYTSIGAWIPRKNSCHPLDLVAEWTDPLPEWPSWAPPWINYITQDDDGRQDMWASKPTHLAGIWGAFVGASARIPKDYRLPFPPNLPWDQCIFERPAT